MHLVKPLRKCSLCRTKFDQPSFLQEGNRVVVTQEYLLHMHSTHGFPPEVIMIKLSDELKEIWLEDGNPEPAPGSFVWMKPAEAF